MNQPARYFFLFLLAINGILSAQTADRKVNTIATRSQLDLLPYYRVWCNAWNPAALDLYDTIDYHMVETAYSDAKSLLKYTTDPGEIGEFYVMTKGVKRVGRIVLDGEFRYNYNIYNELLYNGTFRFDPLYPYSVGDSVDGRQSMEEFNLNANLSYLISDKLSAGINARYSSGVGAKNIDPRNLTDNMEFETGPGILFHLNRTSVGIAASYLLTSTEISYKVVGDLKTIIFEQLGLGFADDQKEITSASYGYFGKGLKGSVQFGINGASNSLFLQADTRIYNEEFRKSGNYMELLNSMSVFEADFSGNFISRSSRRIGAAGAELKIESIAGDIVDMDQRPVWVTDFESYQEWYVVSVTTDSYLVLRYSGDINYNYILLNQSGTPFIDLRAGVRGGYQKSKKTPVETFGFYRSVGIEPYLDLGISFNPKGYNFKPSAGVSLKNTLLNDSFKSDFGSQVQGYFENDYRVLSSEYISTDLGFKVEKQVNIKSLKCIYFDAMFTMLAEINSENDRLKNRRLSLTTGFLF